MSISDQKILDSLIIYALFQNIGEIICRAKNSNSNSEEKSKKWLKEHYNNCEFISGLISNSPEEKILKLKAIVDKAEEIAFKNSTPLKQGNIYSQMVSPFLKIRKSETKTKSEQYYPLKPSKIITTTEIAQTSPDNYEEVFKNFEFDFSKIDKFNVNAILLLLQKHFSFVPSKPEIPYLVDISFYDYSKLVAMVSTCLLLYLNEKNPILLDRKIENNELDEIMHNNIFLLIGGDISGIQNFIYTITSSGALKSLKGRSFYIELLTEHIVSEILRKTGLYRFNIHYLGAGHFYIIAPNIELAKNTVVEVRESINKFLLDEFKGQLQVHIEFEEFSGSVFYNIENNPFTLLSKKIEQSKKRKFHSHLKNIFIVESPHPDCYAEECMVCLSDSKPLVEISSKDRDKTLKLCTSCYQQYLLGEQLTKISTNQESTPSIYKFNEDVGFNISKSNKKPIKIENSSYLFLSDLEKDLAKESDFTYLINCFDAHKYINRENIYIPTGIYHHRDIIELSDIEGYFGKNLISVMKLDVDNLGWIFSTGIPKEFRTFPRVSAISGMLTHYFKYISNHIAEGEVSVQTNLLRKKNFPKERKLSIVYAGGDDLLVIGHWLDVFEFSVDINNYFKKFTGNPEITLSAGISIGDTKHPMYLLSQTASEFLEHAKESNKEVKDTFTAFDKLFTFRWHEKEKIQEYIDIFEPYLEQADTGLTLKGLSKVFIYKLLAFAKNYLLHQKFEIPKLVYTVARIQDKEAREHMKNELIRKRLFILNEREWMYAYFALMLILMAERN